MNHPKRDEWIPLLCGEADAESKLRLEHHLSSCPDCAAEVKAWKRTLGRLDAWKLPPARRVPRTKLLLPVAWAAAAAIVIGAFLAGRLTSPALDVQTFRAELKAELSAEIRQSFVEAEAKTSGALANLETRLLAAANRGNKQLGAEFVDVINALRADDRRATEAMFARLQEQYATDFVLLRKDLETVASFTDDQIRAARSRLVELAGASMEQP